jgi:murein DD-endopeptidase MepM/ murein hydrolase activator NlpD
LLAGVVAAAIPNRIPYGNLVIIASDPDALPPQVRTRLGVEPGQMLYTLYAHLAGPPAVVTGASVGCGQELGLVGNTGWSGNPHLHLETRLGPAGRSFASMSYYDTRATIEERENYELWRMSGEFVLVDPMILIELYLAGEW